MTLVVQIVAVAKRPRTSVSRSSVMKSVMSPDHLQCPARPLFSRGVDARAVAYSQAPTECHLVGIETKQRVLMLSRPHRPRTEGDER